MRRWFFVRGGILALVAAMAMPAAAADLRLPAVFGDNMVLQRGRNAPVWGWASAGADVSVSVAGKSAEAKADADGKFKVALPVLDASGPQEMVVKSGDQTRSFKNVLIGEVWFCSGQSNMGWPVVASASAQEEIAAAKFPQIRLFTVPTVPADTPQSDCKGNWVECSPQTVPGFSAVGYFFSRKLFEELNVPVGMINTSWGGTPAEAWTSRKSLEAEPSLKPLLDRWDEDVKKEKAEKKGDAKKRSQNRPANLYNGMIAPIAPLAVRGAIWYQGESNVGRAHQYRTLFPLMIQDWRKTWGHDFAFGFVQLAPYRYLGDPAACAELWEAQTMTLRKVPNTGMAVTTDISDIKDIHPKNKQDVGKRLALWALAKSYGKDIVYSGPIHRSITGEGSKIRVHFDHVGGGLISRDGKPLSHFAVAGADQKFQPANAAIDGDTVVVESDAVKEPLSVRFAWDHTAEPNFANKEGLPASPFRSDTWKGVTEGNN
jgi:sialate O-acetylesterase